MSTTEEKQRRPNKYSQTRCQTSQNHETPSKNSSPDHTPNQPQKPQKSIEKPVQKVAKPWRHPAKTDFTPNPDPPKPWRHPAKIDFRPFQTNKTTRHPATLFGPYINKRDRAGRGGLPRGSGRDPASIISEICPVRAVFSPVVLME